MAFAEIYKWVDENGNVHYSDAPPLSTKTENVRVQSAPSDPGRALPRLSQPETTASGTGASTDTAAANNDVPQDQAQLACQNAQDDLKVINRSSRIRLKSADGSTRYMTTEEIAERKQQSQDDIDRFCN